MPIFVHASVSMVAPPACIVVDVDATSSPPKTNGIIVARSKHTSDDFVDSSRNLIVDSLLALSFTKITYNSLIIFHTL
jgi:hypothetical protein